jgi:hypothetical protein
MMNFIDALPDLTEEGFKQRSTFFKQSKKGRPILGLELRQNQQNQQDQVMQEEEYGYVMNMAEEMNQQQQNYQSQQGNDVRNVQNQEVYGEEYLDVDN